MTKRWMALFLCIVMLVSLLPASAFAEEELAEKQPHEHNYVASVTNPTCTERGYTTFTCACGDSYIDDFTDPLNHPETEVISGYAPDCVNPGLTDGLVCALCGEELEKQEEVPAAGHMPEYVEEVPATETSTGMTAGTVCSVCGEVLDGLEEIPMLEPAPETEPEQGTVSEPEQNTASDVPPQDEANPSELSTQPDQAGQSGDKVDVVKEGVASVSSEAMQDYIPASGECGDGLTWEYNEATRTLSIKGSGPMRNWDETDNPVPWKSNVGRIINVSVESGVTSIGDFAFAGITKMSEINLPDSVTSIGAFAFFGCSMLESVSIPESLTEIQPYVFSECEKLKSITFTANLDRIGEGAFRFCSSLNKIVFEGKPPAIQADSFYGVTANAYYPNNGEWHTEDLLNYGGTLTWKSVCDGGHKAGEPVHENETRATCTEGGSYEEVVYCSDCGMELRREKKTTEALGHSYGEPAWTWDGTSAAEAVFTCANDSSHVEKVTATITSSTVTEASYTERESTLYTAKADFKGTTYENEKTVIGDYLLLDEPSISDIAIVADGIQISWDAVEEAEAYLVLRKPGKGSWTILEELTDTRFTDTSVSASTVTAYTYAIQAIAAVDCDNYSESTEKITLYASPAIKSAENAAKAITVKWATSVGAEKYQLYRKTEDGEFKKVGKPTTSKTYTDQSVKAGKTYTYAVQALDENGNAISIIGEGTSIVRLTTPTLKSVKAAKGQVTFTWKKVTGATGYVVYRKVGNGNWKKVKKIDSGATVRLKDKTVKKGKTYSYTVQAINGRSKSLYNTTGKKITAK